MEKGEKQKERPKDKKQRLRQWEERLKEREEKLQAREIQMEEEWSWIKNSTGKMTEIIFTFSGQSDLCGRSCRKVSTSSTDSGPIHGPTTTLDTTFPPVIKLNVGGTIFHTTQFTLTHRKPESMIAAMFSGRHPLLRDENGCYFIDRNPREFDILLRFLRSGFMAWPANEEDKECLKVELDYFGIDEPDLSWMLRTDGYGGFKQYPYHKNIYLAVSKETNWEVVQRKNFDCPKGFHWATTKEFKELIGDSTDDSKGYPYYDTGGWKGYVWEGKERIMFCFSDSKHTLAYKHSGHAPAYYLHTGLTESFAGLVCVRDSNTDRNNY